MVGENLFSLTGKLVANQTGCFYQGGPRVFCTILSTAKSLFALLTKHKKLYCKSMVMHMAYFSWLILKPP